MAVAFAGLAEGARRQGFRYRPSNHQTSHRSNQMGLLVSYCAVEAGAAGTPYTLTLKNQSALNENGLWV
jgi:hypothetical protein